MEEKKLFLLDAYALIYRAYYALMRAPRVTSTGLNTSAIFGFCNTLFEVIQKENPAYLAVCFDPAHGKTFRHEQYPEYKAGRDKQPEDITLSIPYIKQILEALRIPVVEVQGYEADDVIGTLAKKAGKEGFTTFMMTPDKDYGQLVRPNVLMYRPSLKGQGFEIRGPKEVCEKYGIDATTQVIDLLALEGDASDNVPGCPGVGEKTAIKLIQEFGSVENLLANTDKLKGAIQKKIVENAGLIRKSKELVTICTDAPVEISPEDLLRREPDFDTLRKIFTELEFRSLMAKAGISPLKSEAKDDGTSQPKQENSQPSLFDFQEETPAHVEEFKAPEGNLLVLESPEEIAAFLAKAIERREIGIYVAADGSEAMTATLQGIALAYIPDSTDNNPVAIYINLATDRRSEILSLLEPVFANNRVTIVSGDIKRDMLVLKRVGVYFAGAAYFDTAVAHYLCAPEMKHDIPTLAMTYLGYKTADADLSVSDRRKSPADTTAVAIERAAISLRLMPLLKAEAAQKGQTKLLDEIEMPFVEVLASMEWEGARIDVAELQKLSAEMTERVEKLENEAYEMAGHPFNVGSPSQVGQVLFGEMKIDPKARKTKSGAWSTAEDVLEKYAKDVPLVNIILSIRALRKLLATYIDALPKLINPITGKIHTTYNQTVTATGRISSANPNLQNIPIRTDDGREIRRAFIADQGCLILSADYSQIELRLMADLSGDKEMIDAFRSGADIHRATAAKIYHENLGDVTDNQRRNAKTANFGIIYGISAFGLAERLAIPRAEAKALIDGYLATYPQVAEYMQEAIEKARIDGFVTTIMGRRRYLPDINSRSNTVRSYAERNAINAPIQGSAADIIKVAMVKIYRQIEKEGLKSRMIMQVHDELIFNVVPDELSHLQELVAQNMENAYKGKVALEVASGVGKNWLEAH